jgi:hypothetical protein
VMALRRQLRPGPSLASTHVGSCFGAGCGAILKESPRRSRQGRIGSMDQATTNIRQRVSVSGRKLPSRTVSAPLLLKELEFVHAVIPYASHFTEQRNAQAKLFYVGISTATRTLTISAPDHWLTFPWPRLLSQNAPLILKANICFVGSSS